MSLGSRTSQAAAHPVKQVGDTLPLPAPAHTGAMSLEQALLKRRSTRAFQPAPLTLAEVAQLLWAAQGITDAEGHRAVSSAGATYPLEVYLVAKQVDGLAAGLYRYQPQAHALTVVALDDRGAALTAAANSQQSMADAAAVIAIAAVPARTAVKYGARAGRYVDMEVGGVTQSVYLQAAALGLGTVVIGSFDDAAVSRVLSLPEAESPLAMLPVGRPDAQA